MQNVRVNFACTKRFFNVSAEAIINVRNAVSVSQVRNISFEDQPNSFSGRLTEGFTFLKRIQNQFKMFLEMCFVLASIVSTDRNASLLTVM